MMLYPHLPPPPQIQLCKMNLGKKERVKFGVYKMRYPNLKNHTILTRCHFFAYTVFLEQSFWPFLLFGCFGFPVSPAFPVPPLAAPTFLTLAHTFLSGHTLEIENRKHIKQFAVHIQLIIIELPNEMML
jgi:hypothetical protein